jgi:molecular chaperone DnaJ
MFHRPARGPRKGANVEVAVTIPLSRVLVGGEEKVHYAKRTSCPTCHGSGAKPGTERRTCDACGGTGQQVRRETRGGVHLQQISTCTTCHGQGSFLEHPCPKCGGVGEVHKDAAIKIKIPEGVEDGMALRVPGHGAPSPDPKGPAGDLFVVIHTERDPRFMRRGADLWHDLTIPLVDAVLGTSVTVPTLEGDVLVHIQPGTQPGTVLRLAGKGLPEFDGHGRGDIRLKLNVHVPEELNERERQLYEDLRKIPRGHR